MSRVSDRNDWFEKGWDDAIDAAIEVLRNAHRYNPIKRSSFEVYEYCPHCDTEVGVIWNVESDGYEIYCPNCGEKIMLCTMCPNIDRWIGATGKLTLTLRAIA